ncbi:MAG: hypothetical protein ACREME_11380, partial [Gemmatimonadales bacterium]
MKLGYATAGLLAAGLVVLTACGGDDNDGGGSTSEIRTEKGLAVAAVVEGLAATQGEETDLAASEPAPAGGQLGGGASRGSAPTAFDTAIQSESMRFAGAPLLQQSNNGVTVQGYGSATADADSAIVEFYFSRNGPVTDTPAGRAEPGFSGGGVAPVPAPDLAQQEVAPITEADVQPVIDAIVAAGVARDQVQFVGQPYFDKFYS